MRIARSTLPLVFLSAIGLSAQQIASTAPPQDQARVFITDSASWETRGGAAGAASGNTAAYAASSSGGARPQTAEIIKTFGQKCPEVIVNNHPNAVDYVVELDHEGGKSLLAHKDKVAVFIRTSGDSIYSKSTLSVGGSVEGACKAILAHWGAHANELKTAAAAAPTPSSVQTPIIVQAPSAQVPGVTIDATVPNCDIEVDGEFVGNTPSTVVLAAGKHQIVVKKTGFSDWTRNMTVSGGSIKLKAEMMAK